MKISIGCGASGLEGIYPHVLSMFLIQKLQYVFLNPASSSLSWRDHIVQIAKSASKKIGGSLSVKAIFWFCSIIQIVYWFYSSLLGILLSYLRFFPLYFSSQ